MTLRLKTHTDYDVTHLEELQRVVSRAVDGAPIRKNRIFNLLWGALSLVVAGIMLVRGMNAIAVGVCVLLGLFFLARGVFIFWFTAMGVRQTIDKRVQGSDYILEKSAMLVINEAGSHRFAYTDCHRLLETEKAIYFLMKDGQGLILDKRNVKGGSVEELRAWMEQRCGVKLEQVAL